MMDRDVWWEAEEEGERRWMKGKRNRSKATLILELGSAYKSAVIIALWALYPRQELQYESLL
jgi:hypothetical protein